MKEDIVAEKETQEHIDTQILVDIYKTQWSDIHHTRNQDWEFSKLILAGFVGLSGLTIFTSSTTLIISLDITFMIFSFLGILVTLRHKNLFEEKMRAINILERYLHVDSLNLFKDNKAKRIFWFIPLPATQNCLIFIYVLSLIVFALFLLVELKVLG